MRRPLRVLGRRDDRGITLVELLVTTVIAGIVLPLVIGIAISAQRQTKGTIDTADSVGDLRVAAATVEREVRLGAGPTYPLFVEPGAASAGVGFWSAYDRDGSLASAPRCVQFKVVDGALLTRSFAPGASTRPDWSAGTAGTVVARAVSSARPFAAVKDVPTTVRITLTTQVSPTRTVSFDAGATTRNAVPMTTPTPDTSRCGVLT